MELLVEIAVSLELLKPETEVMLDSPVVQVLYTYAI